jgi:hypothetical protein
MATGESVDYRGRAVEAFQPVSEMLDVGSCEPLKAAVHGLALATVAVCAAYNAAAWLKRRQRHLAINAIVYGAAVWWEHTHVRHHLAVCDVVEPEPASDMRLVTAATDRDAA